MTKTSPNGPKMAPNGQKHVILTFGIILGPLRPLWDIGKPAIFGHKRAILDPSVHMIEGWQWPKLLQTNLVYV